MTLLPIVERELRVASRRAWTYWLRFFSAASALALFCLVLAGGHSMPQQFLGTEIFGLTSSLVLIACLLSGVFQTSDCLSEEKREGTIGLLFLTDLHGFDVVLGKLASGSLRTLYGLLAAMPIIALPLMMGGVSIAEFGRVILVLLCTLVFSLGIGMVVSTFFRESRQVIALTFFLLLIFAALLPAFEFTWGVMFHSRAVFGPLSWGSPVFALAHSFDSLYQFGGGKPAYEHSVFSLLGIGLGSMVVSCVALPFLWQESARRPAASKGRRTGFWFRLRYGGQIRRARLRLRVKNPFEWLIRRDRLGVMTLLVLGAPTFGFWFLMLAICGLGQVRGFPELMMMYSLGILQFIFKWTVSNEACRHLNDDKRSGALELLLVTPLTVKEIIRGQLRALKRQFLVPMLAIAGAIAVMIRLFSIQKSYRSREPEIAIMYAGSMIVLFTDAWAMLWVGAWEGLRAKTHVRAVLASLFRILFIPWIMFFVIGEFGGFNGSGRTLFITWYIFGVVNDAFWGWRARMKLKKHFRTVAAELPEKKRLKRNISVEALKLDLMAGH